MYLRIKLIDQNSEWPLSDLRATITVAGQPLVLDGVLNSDNVVLNTIPAIGTPSITNITGTNTVLDGRSVAVGIEPGDYIRVQIPLEDSLEEATVRLRITSLAGNLYYDNTFIVYNYDLGNNPTPGVAVDNNPPFIISLREDPLGADLNLVIANFIAYRKPVTNEIFVYNAADYDVDTTATYSVTDSEGNTTDLGQGSTAIAKLDGLATITQTLTLIRRDALGNVLTGFPIVDTSTQAYNAVGVYSNVPAYDRTMIKNRMLLNFNWIPKSKLIIGNNVTNEECVVLDSEVTATLLMDSTNFPVVKLEDVFVHPFDKLTIDYSVINIKGVIETTKNVVENLTYPYSYPLNDTIRLTFSPESIGDYIVKADVGLYSASRKVMTCTYTKKLEGKHWFTRVLDQCNSHILSNLSFNEVTVTVSKLGNDSTFGALASYTIPALETYNLSFSQDGVYKLTISNGTTTIEQVVTSYCNLQTCLENIIGKILCTDLRRCELPDFYEVMSIMSVAITHFQLLNQEYQLNYIYESLSTTKLSELTSLQTSLERLNEYCTNCTAPVDSLVVGKVYCNG